MKQSLRAAARASPVALNSVNKLQNAANHPAKAATNIDPAAPAGFRDKAQDGDSAADVGANGWVCGT